MRLATVDLRALAWLRAGLALTVLLDLALRLRDVTAHYTDAGVMPRTVWLGMATHSTYGNLHMTVGTEWGVAFLACLEVLAALALLVGYHTRAATLATWLLHMSMRHRNPWLADAGDLELGLILFWSLFLPLGARASVDARRQKVPHDERYASLGSVGYVLQISIIYFMAGYYKLNPTWLGTGQGLYYAFSLDQFATPLAKAALGHPQLLESLSRAVPFLELGIAVGLWIPRLRPLALTALVLFHLAVAASLQLGMMVPIAIVCSLGLWPIRREPPLQRLVTVCQVRLPRLRLPSLRIPDALLACACCYVLYINYAASREGYVVPLPIQAFGYALQLYQNWPLFAEPETDDGWFVVEGTTKRRASVDLLRGGQLVSWGKPAFQFPNHRWRRFYQNLRYKHDPSVTQAFLLWAGRKWNAEHAGEEQLYYVRLVYVVETTPPPGQPLSWRAEVLGEARL